MPINNINIVVILLFKPRLIIITYDKTEICIFIIIKTHTIFFGLSLMLFLSTFFFDLLIFFFFFFTSSTVSTHQCWPQYILADSSRVKAEISCLPSSSLLFLFVMPSILSGSKDRKSALEKRREGEGQGRILSTRQVIDRPQIIVHSSLETILSSSPFYPLSNPSLSSLSIFRQRADQEKTGVVHFEINRPLKQEACVLR